MERTLTPWRIPCYLPNKERPTKKVKKWQLTMEDSDKEILNPEAQTDEDSADVIKLPVVSEGSSADSSFTLGRRKRRRRPSGECWMNPSPEVTTGECNQPRVKKAKRPNTEPSAAAAPVRPKKTKYDLMTIKKYKKPNQEPCGASPVKDKVLKNIHPTQPAAPTSQKRNKVVLSSTVQALSLSDLCGHPLKPITLLAEDKADLVELFQSLWALPFKEESTEISPDQFEWFCYRGQVIGFTMDVNSGSICNGKMLLGSFTKKPLWVDHRAATVFNLLTSSVSVTINGRESIFNPGRSFMVPCGSAYSIQNISAHPAVLYFTRISESSN